MSKKKIFPILIACAVILISTIVAYAATIETVIPPAGITCIQIEEDPIPQWCRIARAIPFETAGEFKFKFDVAPGHCSSIRIHFMLDGVIIHTSDWFGSKGAPPQTTGILDFGPVSAGNHILGLMAEGKVGGCNYGTLYSWSGSGVLYTSDDIPVSIDIKPGSDPNCFNSDGHGVIPVAILSSSIFDASTIDPFSVTLDGAEVRVKGKSGNAGSMEDVNGDGALDLVVQIIDDMYYTGDATAYISGFTWDGVAITGSDSVCIRPPE